MSKCFETLSCLSPICIINVNQLIQTNCHAVKIKVVKKNVTKLIVAVSFTDYSSYKIVSIVIPNMQQYSANTML